MICQARRHNDEMQCHKCGLSWQVNDEDPPQCKPVAESKPIPSATTILEMLNDKKESP